MRSYSPEPSLKGKEHPSRPARTPSSPLPPPTSDVRGSGAQEQGLGGAARGRSPSLPAPPLRLLPAQLCCPGGGHSGGHCPLGHWGSWTGGLFWRWVNPPAWPALASACPTRAHPQGIDSTMQPSRFPGDTESQKPLSVCATWSRSPHLMANRPRICCHCGVEVTGPGLHTPTGSGCGTQGGGRVRRAEVPRAGQGSLTAPIAQLEHRAGPALSQSVAPIFQ